MFNTVIYRNTCLLGSIYYIVSSMLARCSHDCLLISAHCLLFKQSLCFFEAVYCHDTFTLSVLHCSCGVFRSCRRVRRLWSWTPVVSPRRVPLCMRVTSETINTSSRCLRWASDCQKEVRKRISVHVSDRMMDGSGVSSGLFLLSVTQLHFIPVDLGSPIVHCSVADPYMIIMTAEGVVTMFVLKSDSYTGKSHRLALQKPQIHTVSPYR